jgi:sugar lactone lactonase YvrE
MKALILLLVAGLLFLPACSGNGEKKKDEAAKKDESGLKSNNKTADESKKNEQPTEVVEDDDYELKVFAEGNEIEHPNGLLVHDGKLIVAGWGLEVQDDFTTKKPGKLVALDLVEIEQEDITESPFGNLDGVEFDGDDGYYVSDWISGKVYHVHGGGHVHEILSLPPGAADIAFLADKKLLIVPEMNENKVTAFDLSDPEATNSEEGPAVAWTISEGIQTPESVYFDSDSGFLFLSQIGEGGGNGKDGDGWISKLSTDGKVIENKWVTGLNAPKGLRSHGGTLWVADIDRLVAIDIASGKISKEVPVPGAEFLNDVACDEEGTVYVSDLLTRKIHEYRRKKK